MRTTSIVLTIALLIPIFGELLRAYETYMMESHLQFGGMNKTMLVRVYAPEMIFNFLMLIVAIILNIKGKYLINTVMCATLVGGYIISMALFWVTNILFTWLKLG